MFQSENATHRPEHRSPLCFRPLGTQGFERFVRIGGEPVWEQDDESPASIAGNNPSFLFSVEGDFEFRRNADAPGQMRYDFIKDRVVESTSDIYWLFSSGNPLYYFGTVPPDADTVYMVAQ